MLVALNRARAALEPGGVLTIWSAFDAPDFTKRLERAGFEATIKRPRSHGKEGARHVVWVVKLR